MAESKGANWGGVWCSPEALLCQIKPMCWQSCMRVILLLMISNGPLRVILFLVCYLVLPRVRSCSGLHMAQGPSQALKCKAHMKNLPRDTPCCLMARHL